LKVSRKQEKKRRERERERERENPVLHGTYSAVIPRD
jgi:hypothetical protein